MQQLLEMRQCMILLSLKTGHSIADTVQRMDTLQSVLRRFPQIEEILRRGRNNAQAVKALGVIFLEPLRRGWSAGVESPSCSCSL